MVLRTVRTAFLSLAVLAPAAQAQMMGASMDAEWIRLKVELGGGLGTSFCFGDGTGTACPCGNLSGVGEGCTNSTSVGALLTASGTPVASNNDYVLTGSQLPPGVPSLFFSGSNDLGTGTLFGDGLLCTSSQIRRLEIVFVDAAGSASTSVGIPSLLGATSGTRSVMQLWYRDPQGPCSTYFNTTGAIDHVWQ